MNLLKKFLVLLQTSKYSQYYVGKSIKDTNIDIKLKVRDLELVVCESNFIIALVLRP